MAMALCFAGELDFDPRTDTVDGCWLRAPRGTELPPRGFVPDISGYVAPQPGKSQHLKAFPGPYLVMDVLIR